MLYQRSYSHRNKTVALQPRKLQEVYVVPEVILLQKQNRGIIVKKTTGSLNYTRGHTPTETKPWYYSHYKKSMLQRSYSTETKPWYYSQENYRKSCCSRGHTSTETKPWQYRQENYWQSLLQRSYSCNKTVVLWLRIPQEVYVVPVGVLTETKPWYYSQENLDLLWFSWL